MQNGIGVRAAAERWCQRTCETKRPFARPHFCNVAARAPTRSVVVARDARATWTIGRGRP